MLIYNCTAAAEETDCEIDDSDVSLKTVNLDLCSMVVQRASSNNMINWYWC